LPAPACRFPATKKKAFNRHLSFALSPLPDRVYLSAVPYRASMLGTDVALGIGLSFELPLEWL